MAYRVTLDVTVLNDQPKGLDEATILSKRDESVRGLFQEFGSELTFWGDGFDYIDNVIDTNYCAEIAVLIESNDCNIDNFVVLFNGIIRVTEISSYNLNKCTISVPLVDNGWNARISNGKKQESIVTADQSLNGDTITPVSSVAIEIFNPYSDYSVYIPSTRKGWRFFSCFEFIISYITDGNISFVSTLLDVGGDAYNWFIFTGDNLNNAGNPIGPSVSFQELFDNLNAIKNIGFAIEDDGIGGIQIRVEESVFFREESSIISLSNVNDVELSFNEEELYSTIKVGSQSFNIELEAPYPPTPLRGFREEIVNLTGICGTGEELDLTNSYTVDSNEIWELIDSRLQGTNTTATDFHLIDAAGLFLTSLVKVDDIAINEDTGSASPVTSVTATDLTLQRNIFPSASGTGINYSVAPENRSKKSKDLFIIETDGSKAIKFSEITPITSSGTNTATSVNHLIDSGATFSADGVVSGDRVNNVTDGTSAEVTNVTATDLTLDADIFTATPRDYEIIPSPWEYNNSFTNFNKLNNWSNDLPQNVVKPIEATNQTFEAERNADVVMISAFPINVVYQTVISNPGGNYDNSTGRYTVPADGLYGLSTIHDYKILGSLGSEEVNHPDFTAGGWDLLGWDLLVAGGGIITNSTPAIAYQNLIPFLANGRPFLLKYIIENVEDTPLGGVLTQLEGQVVIEIHKSDGTKEIFTETIGNTYEKVIETTSGVRIFAINIIGTGDIIVRSVSLKELPSVKIETSIVHRNPNFSKIKIFSDEQTITINQSLVATTRTVSFGQNFNSFANNIFDVDVEMTSFGGSNVEVTFLQGSTFKTLGTQQGGGELTEIDPELFRRYIYNFPFPLTLNQFNQLLDNQNNSIRFDIGKESVIGFREEIERNLKDGMTRFILKSVTKLKSNGN